MERQERFIGCMLGLAIGDALGFPIEFMNRSEICKIYGKQGVTDFVPELYHQRIGIYSDDTQMSMAVANALLASHLDDLESVMRHIRRQFYEWTESDENNRAPGQTCLDAIANMRRGVHWFSSGDSNSKGSTAVVRVAPIGLIYHGLPARLIEVARAVSIATHGHPTALASAIVAAAAVAYLINEQPLEGMLEALCRTLNQESGIMGCRSLMAGYDPLGEQTQKLKDLEHILAVEPRAAFDEIGGGWVSEEAVAAALYCFLRSPNDFRTTVLTAANAGMSDLTTRYNGRCDSDAIACIAGGLSGAYNGIAGIPKEWVKKIENSSSLSDLGRLLWVKARTLDSDADASKAGQIDASEG